MGLFTSAEEKERRAEIERKRIDGLKLQISQLLQKLKDAAPEEAKRLGEQAAERLKDNGLPKDYREEARKHARAYERDSNMRAADEALKMAVAHAKHDRIKERGEFIKRARDFKRRAIALGASEHFEIAVETQVEQIREMGRVSHHGKPTRAKPKDTAPETPNLAKAEGHDEVHRPEPPKAKAGGVLGAFRR